MPRPYSLDLRTRVINSLKYQTQLEVGNIFKVSLRTVKRWVKINHKTGSVAPKKALSTRPRKVDYKRIEGFIAKYLDKTLKEIGSNFLLSDKTIWHIPNLISIDPFSEGFLRKN